MAYGLRLTLLATSRLRVLQVSYARVPRECVPCVRLKPGLRALYAKNKSGLLPKFRPDAPRARARRVAVWAGGGRILLRMPKA